jgi:hypothetical protein
MHDVVSHGTGAKLGVSKVTRDYYCEFLDALCNDSRCKLGDCVPAEEVARAFRRLPRAAYTPADLEWVRLFIIQRQAVMKLICRRNKIRYSAAIAKKYLNDPRIVAEALRRMRQKSKL